MLPENLRGSGKPIGDGNAERFIQECVERYPHLDPDFISQLCYELPDHFDNVLPGFDPDIHCAVRITKQARWVLENVIYYDGRGVLDEWAWHVDRRLKNGTSASCVLESMLENGAWPFPPVVIEASLARTLGIGTPEGNYFLIEGTHRVSYLSRLVQLGRIGLDQSLEIIEIREQDGT